MEGSFPKAASQRQLPGSFEGKDICLLSSERSLSGKIPGFGLVDFLLQPVTIIPVNNSTQFVGGLQSCGQQF